MDRKATQKNFYREIRKSPGRFLSIFFIVAMGVAFFSGIRASEPSMRITGDAYFDGADLMDLEVISTLGITEDDIEAFEEIEGVELAEGSYSSDFLCDTEDRQYVFHVMSLTDKVNQPDVLEGRMPEKVGECLMDADMGYKVGDTVTLKSGTGDPLEDTLKTDTYEIVGLASSPCYVSFERGSATIGSGSISGFMLVPSKTFAMETYSEAYIKVAGAADEIAYTDAYENKVQKVSDRIEEITGERGRIRKQEILADAQEEIDEGRKELEDGRAEADQELSDAAAQIADGEKQLADAKVQLEDGRKQLEDGKAQLAASQKEIDNARSQYESGLSQWKAGQAEYESGLAEYEARKPGAQAQIQQGEEELAASRQQLDEGWAGYQQMADGLAGYDAGIVELEENIQKIKDLLAVMGENPGGETGENPGGETGENPGREGQVTPPSKEELEQQLAVLEETLTQTQTKRAELQATADTAKTQLEEGEAGYQAGLQEIEAAKKQLSDGAAQLSFGKSHPGCFESAAGQRAWSDPVRPAADR